MARGFLLPECSTWNAAHAVLLRLRRERHQMPEFLVANPAKAKRRNSAPGSKAKSSPRKRAARGKSHNPAPLGVLLSMANPEKRRTARQKAAFKRMSSAKRRNPATKVITRYRHRASKLRNPHHTRRNPVNVGGFGMKAIAKLSAGAVGGAFAVRKGTEMILGPVHNQGATGLIGNLVLSFVGGIAVAKLAKQPLIGVGITVGGIVSTYDRWHMESTIGRAAAMFVSGGQSTGKGLSDMEYNDWGSHALSGYIQDEFRPENTYGGQAGSLAMVPSPHATPAFVA